MNIKDIDLNLLVLFRHLMNDRNLSSAAARMGISQPAASQALERLRSQLGDPLLVRQARGMTPTPRALALIEPVSEILERLESVLLKRQPFNIAEEEGLIRFASSDYIELLLIAGITTRLQRFAPRVNLACLNTGGTLPSKKLESGAFDIAVAGFFRDIPDGYYQQTLFNDQFTGVARAGHPGVKKGKMTLKNFTGYPHIMIAPGGVYKGAVDRALKKKNLQRRIAIGMGYFMSPVYALEQGDFLMTIPRKLAQVYAKTHAVTLFDIPLDLNPIKVIQVWHERTNDDPLQKWFRSVIKEVAKEV